MKSKFKRKKNIWIGKKVFAIKHAEKNKKLDYLDSLKSSENSEDLLLKFYK